MNDPVISLQGKQGIRAEAASQGGEGEAESGPPQDEGAFTAFVDFGTQRTEAGVAITGAALGAKYAMHPAVAHQSPTEGALPHGAPPCVHKQRRDAGRHPFPSQRIGHLGRRVGDYLNDENGVNASNKQGSGVRDQPDRKGSLSG